MAILQPLVDLAELCALHGLRHVVLSPGSRSAALTLAFTRNGRFACRVVMDERAAGFVALGMAQQLGVPVVLVCTSGSAAYNYAPAVVEAFFQQIPLLVLTADRPKEWIHQLDGQTIYQTELYGKHVKRSYDLPADYQHEDAPWFINRSVNEAILTSLAQPPGPVHINVPIREPFYPNPGEEMVPTPGLRYIQQVPAVATLAPEQWHPLLDAWDASERILIAGGQQARNDQLQEVLARIAEEWRVPVLGDVISNLGSGEGLITHHDLFLGTSEGAALRPDLLVTFGKSFLSKSLKQFLRKYPPLRHWHIGEENHLIDTFQTLTTQVPVSPAYFWPKLYEDIDYQKFVQHTDTEVDENYLAHWQALERKSRRLLREYLQNLTVISELQVLEKVLESLPARCQLHLANSMPVRYVNMLGLTHPSCEVFANRGTSGIDGCVSTALGAAAVNQVPTYLLVGDVAFLYDRNGLLMRPLPDQFKILVLNNGGGNIFRMIDGPAAQPELEEYFETRHAYTAQSTALESGMGYRAVTAMEQLPDALDEFHQARRSFVLEIFTDPETNAQVLKGLKIYLKTNH
ncbi:2-succinyl-5-enolpyruvyl-6-hydroxy-3-cyclohexene-1-carboxylic-acid synthase [Rhabdobacter roseus]|uniref:2-succinyl-5-enolpyruvyl-6-hydroxy-3-cyclohexene-1-carboxylate synthase n=1 Tax=Rhabdobacter roseus TaxID=1655419 RepID=A0A840TG85_9BACT|nr:2-succinyl-5-enolpyruvyl-6-hydroxy-3-cyclohexene-1-carboxylic-acid synthase [Rhabdobacter roseus]MBB5283176.1 2-succinyl-5-enolpyruvyl-6-hydroxy-3-cyclohexene-1-carboxylate synthase [Rhabdobacter roseus]